jgi:hypothetical protein
MRNLCQAIIGSECFLEMSHEDEVAPDSAVDALEDIATALLSASNEEKEAFVAAGAEEADRLDSPQEQGFPYSQTAQFVRSLPKTIGL